MRHKQPLLSLAVGVLLGVLFGGLIVLASGCEPPHCGHPDLAVAPLPQADASAVVPSPPDAGVDL